MCGDPESFSCYKEVYIWWPESWGSRHPSADRKCGDDWGQDEAGPQNDDKGNHTLQNIAQLMFVLVTTYKCILEVLVWVEITVTEHDVGLSQCICEDLIKCQESASVYTYTNVTRRLEIYTTRVLVTLRCAISTIVPKAPCYQSCMLILDGCSVQSNPPPRCKISHRVTLCFPQSGWSLTDGQHNFGKRRTVC